ncbi:hypothetical protein XaplCFBP3122_02290 [Xanthomonas arboricola pv. populi]|uniref:Uncharacterized protein n=1 Tax=Xanthomonas arboricola pv. populi TaxID=487823 RepID=A0A2S6Z8U6_9XANT|nr:hypothetical protein XaplCFBP3122_02290 [Xanthomonas arboricola pv. populi]
MDLHNPAPRVLTNDSPCWATTAIGQLVTDLEIGLEACALAQCFKRTIDYSIGELSRLVY